jgi:hypothetical protein
MNSILLAVNLILGLCVFVSYGIVFLQLQPGAYINHPMWLGMSTPLIYTLVVFQILAAAGFVTAMINWVISSPTTGVFGDHPWLLPATVAVFLAAATTWAPATFYKVHWLVVGGLVVVAVASILLLAGAAEEIPQRWWIVAGLLLFNLVTVLADGVIWNAVYIRSIGVPLPIT